MNRVKLTQGYFALVDAQDFDRVNQFKWHVAISNNGASKHACRWKTVRGKRKRVWMHQFITGFGKNKVDHGDGDGLNNQRYNLRRATFLKNSKNRGKYRGSESQFKGIQKQSHGWSAGISVRGKRQYLGFSTNPKIAAEIYDSAALKKYGEFARTNKMLGLL